MFFFFKSSTTITLRFTFILILTEYIKYNKIIFSIHNSKLKYRILYKVMMYCYCRLFQSNFNNTINCDLQITNNNIQGTTLHRYTIQINCLH